MIFSPGLGAEDYGHAIVVPSSQQVRNIEDVVDEAVHLWTAETRYGKNPQHRSISGERMGVCRPNAKAAPSRCMARRWVEEDF